MDWPYNLYGGHQDNWDTRHVDGDVNLEKACVRDTRRQTDGEEGQAYRVVMVGAIL